MLLLELIFTFVENFERLLLGLKINDLLYHLPTQLAEIRVILNIPDLKPIGVQENQISHVSHHVGLVIGHLREGVGEPVLKLKLRFKLGVCEFGVARIELLILYSCHEVVEDVLMLKLLGLG